MKERWLRDITKEKRSEEYLWKKKGYDQARALGPVLILEKLSSAGETQAGRPENGCRGCVVSDLDASYIGFAVSQNHAVVVMLALVTGQF